MPLGRYLLLAIPVAWLAGCAAPPPPDPPPTRHRCIQIPNGLVECTEVPAEPPAGRR